VSHRIGTQTLGCMVPTPSSSPQGPPSDLGGPALQTGLGHPKDRGSSTCSAPHPQLTLALNRKPGLGPEVLRHPQT
jgi:hypothetical protein